MKKPKGTKDIFGIEADIYNFIFSKFNSICESYNFMEIITPTFEDSNLFKNNLGESADIAKKELYEFKDKSGREIALRPEGTASVARAMNENKLINDRKFRKLFYIGKMFRYENPQKGRLREFFQSGVEVFDSNLNSLIEIIKLAYDFLLSVGIKDFVLKINNISNGTSRNEYKKELSSYLEKNKNLLNEKQVSKIWNNPFRILDDKEINEEVLKKAPKIKDFYSNEETSELKLLLDNLKELNIPFEEDPFMVRGIDYYCNFVFEFVSSSEKLGTKSTIIGGGQYDSLLNNKELSGVGFGVGIERIFEIIKDKKINNGKAIAYFILENEKEYIKNINSIFKMRNEKVIVEYNKEIKSFSKLFKEANKLEVCYLIFKEKNNLDKDLWTIKSKETKKENLSFEEIKKELTSIYSS